MRSLIRAVLLLALIVIVAFLAFGWWTGASIRQAVNRQDRPAATTGTIDTSAARERGAEIADKAARATARVEETMAEASLTTKIKAKMALDDHVKSRSIDVTTNGTTVTLSGHVGSADERDRALRLARETDGVTRVVDQLRIEK